MNIREPREPTEVERLKSALHCARVRLAAAESISQDAMMCVRADGEIFA
jgi:hypothetical protein